MARRIAVHRQVRRLPTAGQQLGLRNLYAHIDVSCAHGLCLSKEVYTQGTLTVQRARKRVAERIWAAGVNSETTRWSPQQGAGTQAARALPSGRLEGGNSSPRKRKSGNEDRLVLGSKKMRPMWRGRGDRLRDKSEGQGNKKSASSEAKEEGSDRTLRDIKHGNMAQSPIWDGYSISQLRTESPGITRVLTRAR